MCWLLLSLLLLLWLVVVLLLPPLLRLCVLVTLGPLFWQALGIIAALLGGGAGEAIGIQQAPPMLSSGPASMAPPPLQSQDIQQLVLAIAGSTSNVFRAAVMHLLSELLLYEVGGCRRHTHVRRRASLLCTW